MTLFDFPVFSNRISIESKVKKKQQTLQNNGNILFVILLIQLWNYSDDLLLSSFDSWTRNLIHFKKITPREMQTHFHGLWQRLQQFITTHKEQLSVCIRVKVPNSLIEFSPIHDFCTKNVKNATGLAQFCFFFLNSIFSVLVLCFSISH